MSMLNFKYGLHQNLPSFDSSKTGTIYVTSDEQAMYVDLPSGRVRVGQIVTLPDVQTWQNLVPPYSTEAFYYITQANALLKYSGSEWVQINSTAEITNALNLLTGRVSALETAKNEHATKISNAETAISNLQTTTQNQGTAISGLQTKTTALDAAIENLGTLFSYKGQYGLADALPTTNIQKNDIVIHGTAIKIYNGTAWVDYKDIVQEIEDLKASLKEVSDSVASNATIVDIQTRLGTIETWKTEANTAIYTTIPADIAAALKTGQDAQKTADQGVADAAAALAKGQEGVTKAEQAAQAAASAQRTADQGVADAKAAQDDVDALENIVNDSTTGLSKTRELAAQGVRDAATAQGAAEAAQSTADEAKTNAASAQTTANQGVSDAAVAQSGVNTLNNTINNATTGLAAAHTKAQQGIDNASNAKDAADAAQATADSNTTLISNLNTALGQEVTDRTNAISALRNEVIAEMQTADAMVFQGVVSSAANLRSEQAKEEIQKGWTYKANARFVLGSSDTDITIDWADADDKAVHIGDLLIADGTETNGVLTNVVWKQIPSGYVADYNPQMTATDNGGNNISIQLTSGVNKDDGITGNEGDLGKFNLSAASNSAVTLKVQGTAVQIGMEWGSF